MKKALLLLCAVLLLLGTLLPLGGYYLARTVFGPADGLPSPDAPESGLDLPAAPEESGGLAGLLFGTGGSAGSNDADADLFLVQDQSSGQVLSVPRRDYLIGAVAAEMPVSWPDEALKAQAVAAHSYILYCRDHSAADSGAWLTADPARRQGYLTEPVLRSYWGTAYEENYLRLSALVDQVLDQVLYYDGAPAGTSYFAISNGRTESSENVWGAALPYLVPVDSAFDLQADHYEYTVTFSSAQMQQALAAGLGVTPAPDAPQSWFGAPEYTESGYVDSLSVCGQAVRGVTLRRVLGLRSACFSISYGDGAFAVTTRGYGHGVGLSQWGAKALAEQGWTCEQILAHYFPGTELRS